MGGPLGLFGRKIKVGLVRALFGDCKGQLRTGIVLLGTVSRARMAPPSLSLPAATLRAENCTPDTVQPPPGLSWDEVERVIALCIGGAREEVGLGISPGLVSG